MCIVVLPLEVRDYLSSGVLTVGALPHAVSFYDSNS